MKHISSNELFDYRRGEVSDDRAVEIRAHIEECEACQAEWRVLETMETRLLLDGDREVPEGFAERTMRALDGQPVGRETATRLRRLPALRLWFRRLSTVAAVVAATVIFQASVWSPLPFTTNIEAVFALTPDEGPSMLDQAVPDSVFVLTVHPDERFSVPMLEGIWEMDELLEALEERVEEGQYQKIQVVGADPDEPVRIQDKTLDGLKKLLGTSEITYGRGIFAVIVVRDVPVVTNRRVSVAVRPEIRFVVGADTSIAIQSVIVDSIRTKLDRHFQIVARQDPETREVRVEPYIVMRVGEGELREIYIEIQRPKEVTLTVGPEGELVLSNAEVEFGALEEILRRLLERNEEVTLRIIIPEGEGGDASESRIVELANKVGFNQITVKRVKKD
jgi:biopolymer transport protein ExbD